MQKDRKEPEVCECVVQKTGQISQIQDGESFFYEKHFEHITGGGKCAVCDGRLSIPCLQWSDTLFVHPDCARSIIKGFSQHLAMLAETYGEAI